MIAETLERTKNLAGGVARALTLLAGATEHQVVWRSGPVRLRHYAPAEPTTETPLVLITPIINRYRVVDLAPEATLVGSLVERGIPVYVVDWGDPRRIDQRTSFDDYVLRMLPGALRAIGSETVDVLGYCLGGTIASMFAARFPQRVRRLITINAPVEFTPMELFRQWTDAKHFPVERLTRAFGNMPGQLVAQGFQWQFPVASMFKGKSVWPRLESKGFADFFAVLESWNNDGVDIPGAAYRQLIRDLYQANTLSRGAFFLGGEPVDLSKINMPVLVVTCSGDTTCPPAAANALLKLATSERGEKLELRGGHVAPIVGPKAKGRLHGPLADWLLA
ncbi:alpha/beta fold hydrolase [Planctomycetota bacterium]|nr:alpha/beta fold hydrolase [Planctomycetota bacterium]